MPSRRIPRRESLFRAAPWSADGFDADHGVYQQRARNRLQQRRRKPRSPTAEARLAILKPDLRQEVERRMAHARLCRAGSHERLRDGFRWTGGWVDHRYFGPCVEHGLRSTQHPMLRLFVASTLRAHKNLRAGNSKARLLAIGSKLVLLDHAYVSFNPGMRRVIRVDLDQTFASWDALLQAIQGAGVPPPNLAVAEVKADGRVVHPHAYWLLAQAVCYTENGHLRPQRLLRAIERGLVEALRPIGADPGGLSNSLTGKNPLSPLWSCQVMSAAPFNLTNGPCAQPGLTALADHVRPIFGSPKGSPFAGETDVLALLEQSNGPFEVLKRFSFAEVRRFHPRTGGQGGFEDFTHATVTYALSLPVNRLSDTALEKRARDQAHYAWDWCDRQSDRPNRGRCRAACEGKTLRERQRIGALAVAAVKRQQTLDLLIVAYQELVDDGMLPWGSIPVDRVLAQQAKVKTIRTVQKHRNALRAVIEAGDTRRCKDKGESLPTNKSERVSIAPSDLDPQALSPPNPNQLIKKPERSAISSPISGPPLSLLTILSTARVMKPNEPFVPSGPPLAPAIIPPHLASALARLDLFSHPASGPDRPAAQSPTYDFGAAAPLDETQAMETQAMLTRAGFTAANWPILPNAESVTFLPPAPPDTAPVAAVKASAPAAALSEQAPTGPALDPHAVNRTQREFVPGFLEAQAAKLRHQPTARDATLALRRRIHRGGLLDQTDSAGRADIPKQPELESLSSLPKAPLLGSDQVPSEPQAPTRPLAAFPSGRSLSVELDHAPIIPHLQAEMLIGRNMLIENVDGEAVGPFTDRYRSLLKTFLLRTDIAYDRDLTEQTGADVWRRAWKKPPPQGRRRPARTHNKLATANDIDLLILCLDPRQELHEKANGERIDWSNFLGSLIHHRLFHHRPTWVFTPRRIDAPEFIAIYGHALAGLLDTGFTPTRFGECSADQITRRNPLDPGHLRWLDERPPPVFVHPDNGLIAASGARNPPPPATPKATVGQPIPFRPRTSAPIRTADEAEPAPYATQMARARQEYACYRSTALPRVSNLPTISKRSVPAEPSHGRSSRLLYLASLMTLPPVRRTFHHDYTLPVPTLIPASDQGPLYPEVECPR